MHAQYLRIFLGRHSVQAHTHASCFSLLRTIGAKHFMVMLRADAGSKNIFRLKTGVKQYLAVIAPQIQQILAGLFCSGRKNCS